MSGGGGGRFVDEEIARCFGLHDTGELRRFGSTGSTSVAIERKLPGHWEPFAYEFSLAGEEKETRLGVSIPSHIPLHTVGTAPESFLRDLNNVLDPWEGEDLKFKPTLTHLKTFLRQCVEAYTFNPLHCIAHYLPATAPV